MKNIIIIGASGHAKVVIDIVEKEGKYKIIGLIDPFKKIGEKILNYKILGKEKDIPRLAKTHNLTGTIIAIGDNWTRKKISKKVTSIKFVKAIHPNAHIAKDVKIGEGTVIMAGAIINTSSSIGKGCIINTNASLDHDCHIEDFSSLAPGVTTGGNVKIGQCSAISLGAKIINNINIGKHTVIGAGSTVLKDIKALCTAYGTPAEFKKERKQGEKYL